LGNFLAGSRPQLTTAAAALDSTTACTITLARRARAFIVLLAFARFLRPDSCPSVLVFHLYYCTFVLRKQLVRERLSRLSFSPCLVLCCCCASEAFASRIRVSASASANGCKEVLCATSERFEDFPKENTGCDIAGCGLGLPELLGRHTSGTGHGDGDNDAGIGISSSFEHHIRTCDEQQRLKLDHAKATFRTTTTFQGIHKRRAPQCLRRQDANLAEVPRPAERAGCTTQSAKRRQRALRCMDMLALALRRRDHSRGLGSHQLR
jgi:hypothetical protein